MRYVFAFTAVALWLVLTARAAPPYVPAATGPAPLEESEKDNLNVWENVPEYAFAKGARARVLLSAEPRTFMVMWTPPDFARQEVRRTVVLLHPMGSHAYAEFKAALARATKHEYAVLSIQWWVGPEDHLGPRTIYDLADRGLKYLSDKHRAGRGVAALYATGRAATHAYEIAYWDRKLGTNHFALFVCNSGGLHPERPSPLIRKIRDGDFGDEPYAGTHFYLYAGTKDASADESPTLAESMAAAKEIVEESGGKVHALAIDPEHKGPGASASHRAAATQLFLDLTRDGRPTTAPVPRED